MSRFQNIAQGLVGEVRKTVAGARHHIDHQHPDLEFDLVLKGTGSMGLGDRTYDLKPGVLIWLYPGERHRLLRSPGLEMWVASLAPELVSEERMAQLSEQPLRQLPSHELIDLDRLMSQVAQDSDEPEIYNAGIAYLAMRAWRASIDSPAARARPMHPAVGRALLLLREKDAAVSLSELAAEAGIAAPYLSRLLIEQTGRSFIDWRNRIRIDRFMRGYRPGTNLLEAALAAGFGSYARFNHTFNDIIGCAPSDWIKRADGERTTVVAVAPDGYGVPSATTLSSRQCWTSVMPLIAPSVGDALGKDFIDRLLANSTTARPTTSPRFERLDPGLAPPVRDRLITRLGQRDPVGAETLARLIETHNFADTYARLFEVFGLSPQCIPDAVAAYVAVLAVAADNRRDPTPPEVQAVVRQAETALARWSGEIDLGTAQDIHCALVCGVVVAYRALEAARASGDSHELDQLHEAARLCSEAAFGADLTGIELTSHGFARKPGAHRVRAASR
jgi:AraC-like DNA-binding protein